MMDVNCSIKRLFMMAILPERGILLLCQVPISLSVLFSASCMLTLVVVSWSLVIVASRDSNTSYLVCT
jgi:hypothetical protein